MNGMDFMNACTFGFCEKQGFTRGTAWKESLRLMAASTVVQRNMKSILKGGFSPWMRKRKQRPAWTAPGRFDLAQKEAL